MVGAGEVGSALHTVLSRSVPTGLRDIAPFDGDAEVLHIAFPWSDQFVDTVHDYQAEHHAGMVVVHSTVPVGTCDPQGWVHSPIRGRHPNLAPALTAFVKHVGGARAEEAASILETAGITTMVHDRATETEAGKLWELVVYGQAVLQQQSIHAWCEQHGLDFATVYTAFRGTYNAGWAASGYPQFAQPVLEHMPGPIGGHCVRQCAALLDHPLADQVAR